MIIEIKQPCAQCSHDRALAILFFVQFPHLGELSQGACHRKGLCIGSGCEFMDFALHRIQVAKTKMSLRKRCRMPLVLSVRRSPAALGDDVASDSDVVETGGCGNSQANGAIYQRSEIYAVPRVSPVQVPRQSIGRNGLFYGVTRFGAGLVPGIEKYLFVCAAD